MPFPVLGLDLTGPAKVCSPPGAISAERPFQKRPEMLRPKYRSAVTLALAAAVFATVLQAGTKPTEASSGCSYALPGRVAPTLTGFSPLAGVVGSAVTLTGTRL